MTTLREADIGTEVSLWGNYGSAPPISGTFYQARNGSLAFKGTAGAGTVDVPAKVIGQTVSSMIGRGNDYVWLAVENRMIPGWVKSERMKFAASRVDWVGLGLDATGIGLDLVTLGVGGRFTNGAQVAAKAGSYGAVVNVLSTSWSMSETANYALQGDFSATAGGILHVGLDAAGFLVPIIPDTFSIIIGLGQGAYYEP